MGFLLEKCSLKKLDHELLSSCKPFTCGDDDLDDFFQHDALKYETELLGKTYCFVLDENPTIIVCMFTLSNDSIRVDIIPNSRGKKVIHDIPREKHMRRYPGALIGRLGISADYRHQGIGTELMNFIKAWFVAGNNKTGCRFLIVDACNAEMPLAYYQKNKFSFLFSTEEQEAINLGYSVPCSLHTRLMYFDLKSLLIKL